MIERRETITVSAEGTGKHMKQSGGGGEYGNVIIRVEPNTGKGYEFVNAIVGDILPKKFIRAVEEGVKEILELGITPGYPVTDIKVTLLFGTYHDVDSSEKAFKSAAILAVRNALKEAKPVLIG